MHLGRTSLYRLHEAEASREITIRHESSLGDVMFAPAGACFVEAPFGVMHNEDDIIKSQNVRSSPELPDRLRGFLEQPAAHEPAVAPSDGTAGEIPEPAADPGKGEPHLPGCTTTAQKIDAVTKYFHTNYAYVLGLEVPAGQDPLNYFLLAGLHGLLRILRFRRRDPAASGRCPDPLRHGLSGDGAGQRPRVLDCAEHGRPRLGRSVGQRAGAVGRRRGHDAGGAG